MFQDREYTLSLTYHIVRVAGTHDVPLYSRLPHQAIMFSSLENYSLTIYNMTFSAASLIVRSDLRRQQRRDYVLIEEH